MIARGNAPGKDEQEKSISPEKAKYGTIYFQASPVYGNLKYGWDKHQEWKIHCFAKRN